MSLIINFSPFPILESSRLVLRQLTPGDAPQIFKLRSNPQSMKFVPRPVMQSTAEAIDHIELINSRIAANEAINWAITLRGEDDCIGIIGHYKIMTEHYRSEIGYMILPEFSGRGLTSEAVKEIVEYGFNDLKLHSIEAIIDPGNLASAGVLERNDFVREAHLKENQFYEGKFIDTVIYSKLNPA